MRDLIKSCMGKYPVDVLLRGKLVNVYLGEVSDSYIGIKNGKIVYVGSKPLKSRKKLNLGRYFILPGFIDAHLHIESSMLVPSQFAKAAVPHGTVCVIADPHEVANVLGMEGIEFMNRDSKKTPLKVYFMIPSCVPATDLESAGAQIGLPEIRKLKKDKSVLGLGEVMNFQGVIRADAGILDKISLCKNMIIDGHAPMLSGPSLCAYILSGVTSDHECTAGKEAREKLGLGMWIMIREGSASKDLSKAAGIITSKNARRIMLVADDLNANDLISKGHLDSILRRAVAEGIDAIEAIRMVTLNPAEYFGLKHLGGISPGKDADIVVVDDLKKMNVKLVLINGKLVSKNGQCFFRPKTLLSRRVTETMNFKDITPNDLVIHFNAPEAKVRVIEVFDGQLFTAERKEILKSDNGLLKSDVDKDILKVCVIERHKNSGRIGKGFVKGFGITEGALASSVAHDSHNVVAIGTNDEDICLAVNTLRRFGGGLIVAKNGGIVEKLALRVAGLMSAKSPKFVSGKMVALHNAALSLGCCLSSPFATLSFISLPVIPELKITDRGIIDVKKFKIVSLIV